MKIKTHRYLRFERAEDGTGVFEICLSLVAHKCAAVVDLLVDLVCVQAVVPHRLDQDCNKQ